MRKYFILPVIILLNIIKLLSQDIIDPPKLNQLETDTIIQREPDRFVCGWTIGAPGNMLDSAMFISGLDAGDWESGIRNREVGI